MMIRVAERTHEETGQTPSEPMLDRVWRWFASESSVHTTDLKGTVEASAGAGVKEDSLWNKVLGVFGSIKGELKYGNENKTAVTAYRQVRLSELVSLANDFIQECETLLWTVKERDPGRVRQITVADVRHAIGRLRDEYRSRLGESPYNPYKVAYEEQRKALMEIYGVAPESNIRDEALLSLLATGAVLQLLNGEERYMVHPLIVDVLREQGQPVGAGGTVDG